MTDLPGLPDPLLADVLVRLRTAEIVAAVLDGYALPVRGHHGVTHWARVLENGVLLAQATRASTDIAVLFALFHDARRVSEGGDHGHGERGAELARSLRRSLLQLDDVSFAMLDEACRRHTDGLTDGDLILQVCWDADRLDLGRVGTRPRPERLCTVAARAMLPDADRRAVAASEPAFVAAVWGV